MIINGKASDAENWPSEPIDCFITSPPYCLGVDYGTDPEGKKIDDKDRFQWENTLRLIFDLAYTRSTSGCIFWLQVKAGQVGNEILEMATRQGWFLRNTFAWIFSAAVPPNDETFGQFQALGSSKNKVHCGFELIYQLVKSVDGKDPGPEIGNLDKNSIGVPYKYKSNLSRFKSDHLNEKPDVRCRGNVWFIPYETKQKREHPCPFPLKLARNCIKMSGLNSDSLVMDPFCGSGTVGVACAQIGPNFHGIELSSKWFNEAIERIDRVKNG